MTLPLAGVRVLDLSNVLAGPFCAYQLALLGADVIKVEHPEGGDLARRLGADKEAAMRNMGASFVAVNAGKQSITLNLKDPRGKTILRELVKTADVLVENFRPGVMTRLGLDFDALREVNPKLVYCAISGFGMDGEFSKRPAYDQIIQGISGVMSVTGDADSAPLRVGYPISDTVGGLTAAFGICAALVDARASGHGRMLDVSMLEATLATMGWVVSNYLNAGVAPKPMGNENFTAAPSGTFKTGDGPLNIAANESKQFASLCRLIGRADLLDDVRFSERNARKVNRAALKAEIEAALAHDSAANWEAKFFEAGVPAGRVMSVPEILAHPHLESREFIREFAGDGTAERQRVTRAGFRLSDADTAPTTPAPVLSAHTREHLASLGYDDAQIDHLRSEGVI
ncbi:Acetyl-CoA:oxalate CoA-transferase [Paraburkholderia domus]|uniref:Acetyl-CoA:oxalate CoA-transferase n=1 Tax=Paraburkholderia domus TaxID=2793075 RepID=A0A9N8ML55_9BURK|nr:CoA transferase [Paraburkholderia domus]MBK5049106.1 CoA transferase [Burkholderia sp. R-70006]MBK5060075.1 CoA transferase [Burkholderia sp. R-70199]MBK5085294.1 CoA transferase [Burkholderia sp. R-69927]MBK5118339.1 CoA transferase [Burkholderia sp. R-69980]MBK5164176.1 CoA transferase [Burkholderia sp. R-70211]MBK5179786.1 CoA transferase [Burkholderia sp. R-69749]MCI0144426.1 CoA transferase [Paraburkholderia sediminicola]